MRRAIKAIILFLLFVFVSITTHAQNSNSKTFDLYSDTLIIIGDNVIIEYKTMLKRNEVIKFDTLRVNQKGLQVCKFTFSAFSLGQNISLNSDNGTLTNEMKNEIINEHTNYKFFYIKNIVLQTKDGRKVSPSMKSAKIIFSN